VLLTSLASPVPRLPFGAVGVQLASGTVFLLPIALVGFVLVAAYSSRPRSVQWARQPGLRTAAPGALPPSRRGAARLFG
jgi:hypothetical protein